MEPSSSKVAIFDEIHRNPTNNPIDLLSKEGVIIQKKCYCRHYDKYNDLKPLPCCSFLLEDEWYLLWITLIELEDGTLFWPLDLYNLSSRKLELEIGSENTNIITSIATFPKDDISSTKKFIYSWGYKKFTIYEFQKNKQIKESLSIMNDWAINAVTVFQDKYNEIGENNGIYVLMTSEIGETFSLYRIDQKSDGNWKELFIRTIKGFPETLTYTFNYFHDEINKKTSIMANFFCSYGKSFMKMLDLKQDSWGENSYLVSDNVSSIDFLFKQRFNKQIGNEEIDRYLIYTQKDGLVGIFNIDTLEKKTRFLPDTNITQDLCLWNAGSKWKKYWKVDRMPLFGRNTWPD